MRVKLCDKYKTEREDICKRIVDILQLDANHSFVLSELDDDIEKQTAILNMKEEIQKYFACSEISSFKPNFECKRPYLNIVRGILRKEGYTVLSADMSKKMDDVVIRTKRYIIMKNG
jgi:hypothetical protein